MAAGEVEEAQQRNSFDASKPEYVYYQAKQQSPEDLRGEAGTDPMVPADDMSPRASGFKTQTSFPLALESEAVLEAAAQADLNYFNLEIVNQLQASQHSQEQAISQEKASVSEHYKTAGFNNMSVDNTASAMIVEAQVVALIKTDRDFFTTR